MAGDYKDEDEEDNNLPRLHESEREPGPIDLMEHELRRLDGPMSVSNKVVPYEATDVGDTDERANPRASDLEYVEAADVEMREAAEDFVMYDPEMGATHTLRAPKDLVVEDVSRFA